MSDTALFADANLIEPGDLVLYHGSVKSAHALYVALPCHCGNCRYLDSVGLGDPRYVLVDPFGELPGPEHVRRQSLTRSAACQ